jgi:hypothetical protein
MPLRERSKPGPLAAWSKTAARSVPLRTCLFSLELFDVGLAVIDHFLDHIDHSLVVSEADDLAKLLNSALHVSDQFIVHREAQ